MKRILDVLLILFFAVFTAKAQTELVSTGTGSAYEIAYPAAFSYSSGIAITFKAHAASTAGPVTLNINGLGAKTIKKNVTADLALGDIMLNQYVSVIYDGTNFQLTSSLPGSTGVFATAANVTSNSPGNFTLDDFVFGSPQLNNDADVNHYSRMYFDKSKSAFRAGYESGAGWNDVSVGNYSVAMGGFVRAGGAFSAAFGNAYADGDYSAALVRGNTTSSAIEGFSVGYGAYSRSARAFSLGFFADVTGSNSFGLGSYVKTNASNAFVIGTGVGVGNELLNTTANSIMLGSNSDLPTLFISPSAGVGTIGKIGVGTTNPLVRFSNYDTNVTDEDSWGLSGDNTFLWAHIEDGNKGYAAAIFNEANTSTNNGLLVKINNTTSSESVLTLNSGGLDIMKVTGEGFMSLGKKNPLVRLDVYDNSTTRSGAWQTQKIYGTGTSSTTEGVALDVYSGVYDGGGVGGDFYGVKSFATWGANSYGIYGEAGYGNAYGVYGKAISAATNNYGVYGIAANGTNNWAGYFDGRGYFSGNVGIGTSSPSAKLEIAGSPGVDGIRFPDGTLQTTAASSGAWTKSGTSIYPTTLTDFVGIGTSTPLFALDVRGSSTFAQVKSTGYGGFIIDKGTVADNGYLILRTAGADYWSLGQQGNLDFRLYNWANSRSDLTILNSNGNVGIGTTTPSHKLDVVGDRIRLTKPSTTQALSLRADGTYLDLTAENTRLYITATTNESIHLNPTSSGNVILAEGGGNVGINTAAPSEKLEVAGNIEIPAANDYKYATAQTRIVSLPANSFRPTNSSMASNYTNSGAEVYSSGAGGVVFFAPIIVPQGSTINRVDIYVYDNSTLQIGFSVNVFNPSTGVIINSFPGGFSAAASSYGYQTISNLSNIVTDVANQNYYIAVTMPLGANYTICGAKITYSVTKAD